MKTESQIVASNYPLEELSAKRILTDIISGKEKGKKNSDDFSSIIPNQRKKRHKIYDPIVWILYDDFAKSASSLSNYYLSKTIVNIIRLIVCAHYYFAGIRSNRIFKHFFSKENIEETIASVFPGLDVHYKFKFVLFKHKVGKWARQCYEHMDFLEKYLVACLKEWSWRVKTSPHEMYDIAIYFLTENNIKRFLPKANLKKVVPVWQMIPPKYRSKDIYEGFRNYYAHLIKDPYTDYAFSNRDIPEFVLKKKESLA